MDLGKTAGKKILLVPFFFSCLAALILLAGNAQAEELQPLIKKAEAGDLEAQVALGERYESGKGIAVSYAQARFWYLKAAEAGDADGQRALGVLYEKGLGVGKDFAQAAAWYRLAAEQGLARAQANLGQLYENGQGVERDYAQAMAWYQLAAASGYPRGEALLGRVYELGLGVEKDLAQARALYQKAAARGYGKAGEYLTRLGKAPVEKEPEHTTAKAQSPPPPKEPKTTAVKAESPPPAKEPEATAVKGEAAPPAASNAAESGSAESYFYLGNEHAGAGRFDQALAAFNQALLLEPDNVTTLHNLAICLAQMGRPREAIAPMTRVIALTPGDPKSREELAALHIAGKEYEQAIVILKAGLALDPTRAGFYHALAIAHGQLHDFDKAVKSARIAGALGYTVDQELLAYLRKEAPGIEVKLPSPASEGYYLRQLVVATREQGEECLRELEHGKEFATLVAEKALPAFRDQGGYFAYYRAGESGRELKPELSRMVEELPPFAFTPVIPNEESFRIFQKVVVFSELLPPPTR